MRGRPLLFTSYEDDQSILPTVAQRVAVGVLLLVALTIPLQLIPGLRWLGQAEWLLVMGHAMIFAIGALGLNILTGVAGQVSLGHAFFMGIGAYSAAILGGQGSEQLLGMDLPIWIWLPAAGVVAALVGVLVAPTAVRVRGLYLAFLTIALVFIGEHIFRNFRSIAGPPGLGRDFPRLEFSLWREEEPLIDFASDGSWFGIEMGSRAKSYVFMLGLMVVFVLIAKNISRTRVGRAFAAIRDRDIAAEVMGVNEGRYKLLAFGISSFMAGISGALFASFFRQATPETWNLLLSVEFIAIILIGGAGTVAGTVMGAFFVVMLPELVRTFTRIAARAAEEGAGVLGWLADFVISTGGDDGGLVGTTAIGPGLSVFQMNLVLYGFLIVAFLLFEPLGLYGIWIRIRNYWKGWPFTY